ncbi:winged helix DNA-binding domain-containing protein [Nocardioides sp. CCNWLW239]|uniref:winged helix DNA-binding domain-containing protein n=1 Tax=Nocardioides sp. CCNWLW239 TaxID=3128902 RepID=UPI003017D787
MRTVTDRERRARLARRHGLAPAHRYADVAAATQAMTAWHATEAATVHLALHARVRDLRTDDVERALYEDRSLVKQLAMRRTLFAFPRELVPAVWGSASARVAAQEEKNLHKWLTAGGVDEDQDGWIEKAYAATLAALSDGVPRTTTQLRELVPELDMRFQMGAPDKKWGGAFPIGRWVIGTLAAQGRLMRATNLGHWRLNKPAWTLTEAWLGEMPPPLTPAEGYAELVRRWLGTFGPGTEADLVWWLGSTKSAVRAALAAVGAVEVGLEGGGIGWVLPDDPIATSPEPEIEPWAALLPTLDPTVMGWKERGFYLAAEDVAYLFDSNGNAGNTAWWDGRIVGAWAQDEAGRVHPIVRHDIGDAGRAALAAEAERLTEWLDGVLIVNVYKSRQMKEARLP